MSRIDNSLFYLFLDTAQTPSTPTFTRVTKATNFAITMNAQTEDTQYIVDKTSTTLLNGYKPAIDQTLVAFDDDPIFTFLFDLYENRKVGSDASTTMLIVHQQAGTSSGSFVAEQWTVTITITTYDIMAKTLQYTLSQSGDSIPGEATISNGVPTFTPTVAA